jgi:type III pantothenate kinase
MKLLIDIGNSNTKLGIWKYGKLFGTHITETQNILKIFVKYTNKPISEIFLTSVVSAKDNKKILSHIKRKFNSRIYNITSSKELLGVKNKYKQPSKLGNDRWCGIVGLYKLYKKPLLIVNCGTAISIDVINMKGIYLGGYILGGFDGYKLSFLKAHNLKNIKLHNSYPTQKLKPSRSTKEAIIEGYALMVTAAIEKSYKDFSMLQTKKPLLLIGGGYGKIISQRLAIKNKYEPNLVLKSLGLISDYQD